MRYRQKIDPHNGLLNVRSATPLPGYWRYYPSPALAPFVEHFWTVEWDLAEPILRETLPYPNAHIILEPGVCELGGVSTKKFSRVLSGRNRVIGTKFQPGGLRPFIDQSVSALTDRVVPLENVFGASAADLGRRTLAHADHHAAIGVIESFLLERDPRVVDELELLRRITARIAGDREMRAVEPLAREFGLGVRSLQRLFREFVGVSPKWMVRRFRLQEAAETLAAADRVDWSELALDLGYADQAHFNRDFKRLIGTTPGAYFKALAELAET